MGKQGRQLHKHAREQARQHPAVALEGAELCANSSTFSMPLSTMPSLAITFQWRARKVRMRRQTLNSSGPHGGKEASPHRNT